MRELVGLRAGGERSGVDAFFDFDANDRKYAVPIELKSTTIGLVSTARDVGLGHVEKWRARLWVFGFYGSSGGILERVLALGPDDMEPWISRIERYIAPDFMIGERTAAKLGIEDLHAICGEKDTYTLDDAKSALQETVECEQVHIGNGRRGRLQPFPDAAEELPAALCGSHRGCHRCRSKGGAEAGAAARYSANDDGEQDTQSHRSYD